MQGDTPHSSPEPDEARAVARLPGRDIVIHHVAPQPGQGERLTISLQAMPMPPLTTHDPFSLWIQMVQLAWLPWLAATSSLWALPRVMGKS
jgi:hypothetical protein